MPAYGGYTSTAYGAGGGEDGGGFVFGASQSGSQAAGRVITPIIPPRVYPGPLPSLSHPTLFHLNVKKTKERKE